MLQYLLVIETYDNTGCLCAFSCTLVAPKLRFHFSSFHSAVFQVSCLERCWLMPLLGRRLFCQVGVDSDGHPELYAAPLSHLTSDFPLVPSCMGRLVPQQVNLWMGATQQGAWVG